MATILPNRAEIVYNYGEVTNSAISNTTQTTLLDQYTMTVTKTAVDTSVRSGSDAVYVVRVENSGSGPLYNITITDDLGGTTDYLSYVENTAQFYVNGEPATGSVNVVAGDVIFTLQTPLQSGDSLIVVYASTLSETAQTSVTNTATVQANSGTSAGPAISATAQETITVEEYASLTIVKTADKDTVVSGDTLTYTFTVTNTGNIAADTFTFTDALPQEFTVTEVTYTVNGVTTVLAQGDYAITSPNTITIPTQASEVVLTVPAQTQDGPGVAIITITGTVA